MPWEHITTNPGETRVADPYSGKCTEVDESSMPNHSSADIWRGTLARDSHTMLQPVGPWAMVRSLKKVFPGYCTTRVRSVIV